MTAPSEKSSRSRPVALASQSPRRLEILRRFGFEPHPVASSFDEAQVRRTLAPGDFALAAARGKAEGARHRLPIVAADTIVVVDGEILGKPGSAAEAAGMLRLLSARSHEVLTAVVLRYRGRIRDFVERSRVDFRGIAAGEIEAYVATGEPFDKAGAYAIQGGAARFVRSVSGSYWNVVGFPIERFERIWEEEFPGGGLD